MMTLPLHFCIIERDLFIAADMRAGLELASPGCRVHDLRDVADLERTDPAGGTIFITKLGWAEIHSSGLAELAQRVRGRIVMRDGTGLEAEIRGQGHESLPSPFSNRDLQELVERLNG